MLPFGHGRNFFLNDPPIDLNFFLMTFGDHLLGESGDGVGGEGGSFPPISSSASS